MRRFTIVVVAVALSALPSLEPCSPPARAQEEPPGEMADAIGQAHDLADAVVDRLVEHGVTLHRPDYEDPVMRRQRRIVVTGEINALVAKDVISKLLYLDRESPSLPIDLFLRTNGGWADDAFAVCDAMQVIRSPVNTWAMGACDSAGAVILAAGTGTRRALPHSMITLHFNEEEGDEPYSPARVARQRAVEFWKRNARLPEEFLPLTGDTFHALSPEKALKFGIVDEVVEPRKRPEPPK